MSSAMRMICLCPTYGRPRQVLENSLACFLSQDYSGPSMLWILDDGNTVVAQHGKQGQAEWAVVQGGWRRDSLPRKYNEMVTWSFLGKPTWGQKDVGYVVWDDDDLYLPWHLSSYAAALQSSQWVHPETVLSTYDGLHRESAAGRFHGSLAIRGDLLSRLGGWVPTRRADFDQQQISQCARVGGPPGRPIAADGIPSYVFRWADSGASHCQGLMSSPDNIDWYDRVKRNHYPDDGAIGELVPQFDAAAKRIYQQLGVILDVTTERRHSVADPAGDSGGDGSATRSDIRSSDPGNAQSRSKKLRRSGIM